MYTLKKSLGQHFLKDRNICRRIADEVAATRPQKLLEVGPGDPLLYIESVARNAVGDVVECFLAWHRADRMKIEMDVVRDGRPLPGSSATSFD